MTETHTILMLGSSGAVYHEDGDPLTSIIEARLREIAPDTCWRCVSRLLFMTPTMSRYAVQAVEETKPDTVVVTPSDTSLFRDTVSYSIRQRWPRLYPFIRTFSTHVKGMAGGPMDVSPRRWIFSAPQWLAARAFGVAPPLSIDQGIAFTNATLDALAGLEGVHIIAGLMPRTVTGYPEVSARLQALRSAVQEKCRQHRIPTIESEGMVEWSRNSTAADGLHRGFEARQARGAALAQALAAMLPA